MPFYRNNNIGFAPHIIFAELFYFVNNKTYYDNRFLSIFNILFLELSVIFLFML